MAPYSLGNSLDWKLGPLLKSALEERTPYSLGNSLDWKQGLASLTAMVNASTPYSLGNSLDWKPQVGLLPLEDYRYSLLARELT